jgi:hypothetical protein
MFFQNALKSDIRGKSFYADNTNLMLYLVYILFMKYSSFFILIFR